MNMETAKAGPGRSDGFSAMGLPPAAVLVVDDNAGKRMALKSVLSPLGYRIVEADSGRAALRCLMAQDFAVVLLDVRMPGMDGFETASLIRARQQSEMTPIIFTTAHRSDEISAADRYAEGAVDFIFSPVPPSEIRAKVSVFANLYMRAELLAGQARAVQASADQLRMLTDAAPIGIFQTDGDNRYVYTNPRWTEITGIAAEDAVGREWDTILDSGQRAELRGCAGKEASDRAAPSRRFELRPEGLIPRIVLVTCKSIPAKDGGSTGWVGTLADVTAEAGAEAAMSDARDTALSATVMQRNFTTSASHELRTPTTSILGFVEAVLESESLSKQDRGFLDIVLRNALRLNQLIDDLLILGQAEIGATMMHLEPTALVPLVERVISTFSGAAEHAGLALLVDQEPDIPSALVDPLRLEQALANLISNALKFTPCGGEIRVTVRHEGDTVELSVADTGLGIDPSDIDNIFGRFFRSKVAIDSSVKGTGLGLAIAKKMIEAQDGHISVTSAIGEGSKFTIALPLVSRAMAPI